MVKKSLFRKCGKRIGKKMLSNLLGAVSKVFATNLLHQFQSYMHYAKVPENNFHI